MDEFEKQYEESAKKVYRFLMKLCGDPDLAEEITQETFVRAYLHLNDFKGKSNVDTWLCSIARNIFFDEVSKRNRHLSITDNIEAKDPFKEIENKNTALSIYSHLHKLQEPYKEVFILRTLGELSFKEIASIHDKSESWAKMTFYRAKAQIVKEMEKNHEE